MPKLYQKSKSLLNTQKSSNNQNTATQKGTKSGITKQTFISTSKSALSSQYRKKYQYYTFNAKSALSSLLAKNMYHANISVSHIKLDNMHDIKKFSYLFYIFKCCFFLPKCKILPPKQLWVKVMNLFVCMYLFL